MGCQASSSSTSYLASWRSAVRIGRFSTCACATRRRSKGSLPLAQFVETFHRITDVTPSHYLKLRQIGRAKVLLKTTDLSVGRVAYRAAFGSKKTFHRAFEKHVGMTPEEWRNRR